MLEFDVDKKATFTHVSYDLESNVLCLCFFSKLFDTLLGKLALDKIKDIYSNTFARTIVEDL